MVFDFPPLKKGEYIEKYFMDYIKMNNITLKRKYINVAWATLYYDQQFKRMGALLLRLSPEWHECCIRGRVGAVSLRRDPATVAVHARDPSRWGSRAVTLFTRASAATQAAAGHPA